MDMRLNLGFVAGAHICKRKHFVNAKSMRQTDTCFLITSVYLAAHIHPRHDRWNTGPGGSSETFMKANTATHDKVLHKCSV